MATSHPEDSRQKRGEKGVAPLDWPGRAGLGPDLAQEIRREVRRRAQRRRQAWGAAALLVLVACGLWWRAPSAVPPPTEEKVTARVTAPERRVLADGSVVEVRPGAAVDVEYSTGVRLIRMKSGEAHFEVVRDPARPFIVQVDGIDVHAVGTGFVVAKRAEQVEVVVTHGRVAVGRSEMSVEPRAPSPAAAAVLLDAGDGLTVSTSLPQLQIERKAALSESELRERLAWRAPRIEFFGARLGDVAELFNAHGHVRLRPADERVAGLRISGVLRADNVETLLDLLAADHGVVAERVADEIVLRRR